MLNQNIKKLYINVSVPFFNGISAFVGNQMPKPFLKKNSDDTILPIPRRIKMFIYSQEYIYVYIPLEKLWTYIYIYIYIYSCYRGDQYEMIIIILPSYLNIIINCCCNWFSTT